MKLAENEVKKKIKSSKKDDKKKRLARPTCKKDLEEE